MEISQISFCNKIGYNITNDKEKEHILNNNIFKGIFLDFLYF